MAEGERQQAHRKRTLLLAVALMFVPILLSAGAVWVLRRPVLSSNLRTLLVAVWLVLVIVAMSAGMRLMLIQGLSEPPTTPPPTGVWASMSPLLVLAGVAVLILGGLKIVHLPAAVYTAAVIALCVGGIILCRCSGRRQR